MKKTLIFSWIALTLLLITSCEKDEQNLEGGTYKGSFTATYQTSELSENITLKLRDGEYSCSSRGSGTYTFENGKIIFFDENIWTCDFDANLILRGEYNYSFDGNKLVISKEVSSASFKYVLR